MKIHSNEVITKQAQLFKFLLPVLLAFTLFMAGCGTPVHKNAYLDFGIIPQQAGVYVDRESALITARDKRKENEVITYHPGTKQQLKILADPSINSILTDQLAKGFADQGLILTREEPGAYIMIEIVSLHADIARDKGLYLAEVTTSLRLTVETTHKKLTKTYNRDADRKSISKPLLQDVEEMIRDQLQEIVNLILIDREIQTTIKQQS
ncbi:YajG family lipoprotein [Desulfopila sp. IMCC35008]|uniref:YajG family lipoprotein n=1 Tax=Desulfopila sp. IMCC35008 TaxID=2653858 RepID=UPI0013D2FC16|nr:YajG family lipoprotein [Desulfopila sp. IMCC35008]